MGRIEERLAELGLELPEPFAPPPGVAFKFDLVRIEGELAHVSGHGPMDGAEVLAQGKVGGELDVEAGAEAARQTGLSILASLRAELDDLDRIRGWVKALGLVNCAPGFNKTPAVVNGFSGLILDVWGDEGHHARSAIGVAELPFDWPVEVEAIVSLRPRRRPARERAADIESRSPRPTGSRAVRRAVPGSAHRRAGPRRSAGPPAEARAGKTAPPRSGPRP
jgi:enamine deaminase RidA (YjgF/YER057c/UK114 family)